MDPGSSSAQGDSDLLPLSRIQRGFVDFALRERFFFMLLAAGFLITGVTYEHTQIAAWIGFALAGYSVVANDSIQTIGTFLASNSHVRWWILWIFIGGLFLLTVGNSWVAHGGDVSYERLTAKGFAEAPTSFSFLQLSAPLFLLILTRLKMPVSTTFLILSCFTTSASGILKVLTKSMSGYLVAFTVAIVIWLAITKAVESRFEGEAHPAWRIFQWITSGILWSVWLMQDAANVAVFLPRKLTLLEFTGFAGVMFFGLGVLLYRRGDKIQEVVNEKRNVEDVRSASLIDLIYALILYYFKIKSKVPMSTTWVFIGLLAGREIAMALRRERMAGEMKLILRMVAKDLLFVCIGLAVSLILAVVINDTIREAWLGG